MSTTYTCDRCGSVVKGREYLALRCGITSCKIHYCKNNMSTIVPRSYDLCGNCKKEEQELDVQLSQAQAELIDTWWRVGSATL